MSAIDAGPAWSAWSQITPVAVGRASAMRYARLTLPPSISPGPDGTYADLRVLDADGDELPYALDPERLRQAGRDIAVIDVGFIPHRGTQAVIDVGRSGELADGVQLEIDPSKRPTYFITAHVEASDDRKTWRVAGPDTIVYRVAQDAGRGSQTIVFSPTRSRWIRVLLGDPATPLSVTGARRFDRGEPADPVLVNLPMSATSETVAGTHDQRWTFASASPVRPAAVFALDSSAVYERQATVEVSDDAKTWTGAGDGTISRFAQGGSQKIVPVEERTVRFVRFTVHNGDDAPLRKLVVTVQARPHVAVFAAHAGSYRLLSGNAGAAAPSFDLAARLRHENWRAMPATVGPTIANGGFRDARPIGERFPWLVTGALIGVALVLGVLALRVVRSAPAT